MRAAMRVYVKLEHVNPVALFPGFDAINMRRKRGFSVRTNRRHGNVADCITMLFSGQHCVKLEQLISAGVDAHAGAGGGVPVPYVCGSVHGQD